MKKTGLILLALTVIMRSCNDEPAPPAALIGLSSESPEVEIDRTNNTGTVKFDAAGGTVTLTVTTNQEGWQISEPVDWCTVAASETTLTLTAHANPSTAQRNARLTVWAGTPSNRAAATLDLIQYGMEQATLTMNPSSIEFAPEGGEKQVAVSTNQTTWSVTEESEWLDATKNENLIVLRVRANESLESRSAEVTVKAGEGDNTAVETLTVTQPAPDAACVEVTPGAVEISPQGGEVEVTVATNQKIWAADTEAPWLEITEGDGKLILSAGPNDGDSPLRATVTVTAGEGFNIATTTVEVTQPATDKRLILELTITADGATGRLPLDGTVDCTVNWGDGSEPEAVTDKYPSHVYQSAGTYQVAVSGIVTSLNSNNPTKFPTAAKKAITAVKQWGNTSLTSMRGAFYQCSNLASLPETTGAGFAYVTTFMQAFYQCTSLSTLPADLFAAAQWNETFQNTFNGCTALTSIPAALLSQNSQVTSMASAFSGTSISEIPEGLFDALIGKVTFAACFQECKELTTVPARLFEKCTEATTFSSLFQNCSALETIPAGLFDHNPNATYMASIFSGTSITTVPAGLFDAQTGDKLRFSSLFKNCKKLTCIPPGLFDKNTGAMDFTSVFEGCGQLTVIPPGLFDNNADATNFMSAFMNCSKLTGVPAGLFDNCKKVFNFKNCFSGCVSLTGESPYQWLNVNGVQVKVHLYQRNDYLDTYTKVTQTLDCFKNCTGLSDYRTIADNYPDWQ